MNLEVDCDLDHLGGMTFTLTSALNKVSAMVVLTRSLVMFFTPRETGPFFTLNQPQGHSKVRNQYLLFTM